jgi:cytochrome c peroxidase
VALAARGLLLALSFACAGAHAQGPYAWQVPPGFPIPAVPVENPQTDEKVALGARLFADTRLSVNSRYACASCHQRSLAYTDGRALAQGATGQLVRRSAMSLTNVAYNVSFTWADPGVKSLEAQMRTPLFNQHPLEMGFSGALLRARLQPDAALRAQFAAAFPREAPTISAVHVIKAIAAYERTLISGASDFDRHLFGDGPLSEAAKRGMDLFFSTRIGCAQCHAGLNFSGPWRYQSHIPKAALFANNGLHEPGDIKDVGLAAVTHRAGDVGKFRVPTLRNIALTAPYMHDGSLPTLRSVIEHYERAPTRALADPRLRQFHLSESEGDDLIAFLESLTDREFVADLTH